MFIFPDRIVSHTPLIAIMFCASYFLIYIRLEGPFIYLVTLLSIAIGLLLHPDLDFILLIITYFNIVLLCLVFTKINRATRLQIFNNTQLLLEHESLLNQNIDQKENENSLLISQLESTMQYGQMILDNHFKSDHLFLKSVFSKFFDLCKCSDKAFILIIRDSSVQIVKSIGFSSKILKSNLDIRTFDAIGSDKIVTRSDFLDQSGKTLLITVNIEESSRVIIALGNYNKGPSQYEENFIRLAHSFQNLIKTYYMNREYLDLQSRYMTDIIFSLIEFLEIYDPYTKGHSVNVANFSKTIAKAMQLDPDLIDKIYWAGLLHDIGKLIIPQEILNKNGKLTSDEYQQIKEHPVTAYKIMKSSHALKDISQFILSHHERFDGTGYPNQLKGNDIPLESRILAVADSFEAMTSERPYRAPMTIKLAIDELIKYSGTQFDSNIVQVFLSELEKGTLP
jgi:putative nucleotidyltransferase with HDIG domain